MTAPAKPFKNNGETTPALRPAGALIPDSTLGPPIPTFLAMTPDNFTPEERAAVAQLHLYADATMPMS